MEPLDWLREHLWAAWVALAILLGVAELFSLDLILLMLAAGALAGAVAAVLQAPDSVQVLVAVATSVGMLATVRPTVVKRLHSGPELRLGHSALVGRQGIVVDEITPHSGQIKLNGELWTARPYDDMSVITPGATVDVLEIRGATALVHEVPRLDP